MDKENTHLENITWKKTQDEHHKPSQSDTNLRSSLVWGLFHNWDFLLTSFKEPAVGSDKNNGPADNSPYPSYYANIRAKSKCQNHTSTVLERFFKTFNKFHTLKFNSNLNTHQTFVLLPNTKKSQKSSC